MNPVSGACACNGSIAFVPPNATPASYLLVSLSNGTNYTFSSTNGFIQNGLCGGTYLLQTTSNGQTTTAYYTLTANGNTIVPHVELARCTTSANFNLSTLLPGLPAGGTWYDPGGNPTTAIQTTATALEGFYAYVYVISGCTIATGVLVDINTPPNTGNQTTTLICDTWLPFDMLLYMQGAPDPGGQWYNAQGVAMNGIFDPASMSSALFTYLIDDVPGCAPAYTTMYIQENTTPQPGLPSSILVCEEGTAFNMFNYIEGAPTPGGTWSNPFNQSVSSTFTPGVSIEGTYTYTIDALTPCVDQEVTLTISTTPNDPSGESSQLHVCSNTPGFNLFDQLDGAPVPGGTWTTSNGTLFNGNFTVLGTGAGTYTYYYPNVGCNPIGAQIEVIIEPLLNAGNNYSGTICSSTGTLNLQALLSAGAATTGTWYNASNQIINPVLTLNAAAEQEYTYFINGNVCPDDYSFFEIYVDQPPPALEDTAMTICANEALVDLGQLYPAFPAVSFYDLGGVPIGDFFDPSSGITLQAMAELPSGNICPPSQAEIQITVETPIALAPLTAVICENSTMIHLDELAPSFGTVDGSWYTAGGTLTPALSPWNPNELHYYFVPTGFVACPVDTGHLDLSVSSFVASDTLTTAVYCALDDAFPLMVLLPSNWSNNGIWTLNSEPVGPLFDPAFALDGTYVYTIPGQGACPEASLHVPLDVIAPPQYDIGPDLTLCASQNTVVLGTTNSNYNFNWSPGIFLNDPTVAAPVLTANPDSSQITILQYEVSVSNGVCTANDTVNVTFYPLPVIDLEDHYSLCLGDQIAFTLAPTNAYLWEPAFAFDDPTSNVQVLQPMDTTQLHVEAVNNWNCSAEADFTISVLPTPNYIVLSEQQAACYSIQDTLRTIGDEDYTYDWLVGDVTYTGDSIALELFEPGDYSISVLATDDNGCQTEQTLPVQYTLHPSPTAIFETTPSTVTTVNNTVNTINLTTNAQTFEWTLDGVSFSNAYQPEIELPGSNERNFEICQIATNSFGCQDTSCRWVFLENEYLLWAPNAFTPDNDYINDVFSISMMGFEEDSYSLVILDRWGVEVFRSTDPTEVWVGDHQSGAHYCQPDIYSWILNVKKKDSAEYETYRGHITLIR